MTSGECSCTGISRPASDAASSPLWPPPLATAWSVWCSISSAVGKTDALQGVLGVAAADSLGGGATWASWRNAHQAPRGQRRRRWEEERERRKRNEKEAESGGDGGVAHKTSLGFFRHDRIFHFSLLHLKLSFTTGLCTKNIPTCLLYKSDEMDCGLISTKLEGLFANSPKPFQRSRASRQGEVLRNKICGATWLVTSGVHFPFSFTTLSTLVNQKNNCIFNFQQHY